MLNEYLNNRCILKVKTGANEYNEAIYQEKEIKCRLINKYKVVKNEKGEEIVSSGVVQCKDHIKAGDRINDRVIISVNYMTALETIIGYVGYLL